MHVIQGAGRPPINYRHDDEMTRGWRNRRKWRKDGDIYKATPTLECSHAPSVQTKAGLVHVAARKDASVSELRSPSASLKFENFSWPNCEIWPR